MKPSLRGRFERFCYRHGRWGIPDLMLWIGIGNAILYVFGYFVPSMVLYNALCWDAGQIFHGQIWRLFSYVFIPSDSNLLFLVIGVVFYCYIGRTLENEWGTLRFTLYYLSGVILTDVAALLTGVPADNYYLNLSLFLAFATLYPENYVLVFFVIPLKMKYLAWFDIAVSLLNIVRVFVALGVFSGLLYATVVLVPLLNYVLFFGRDIRNVLPMVHAGPRRSFNFGEAFHRRKTSKPAGKVVDFHPETEQKPYHHKCTVCGRTDTDYPDLEFRYCSRCNGYYCYCQDHINNHVHIK